MELKNGYIREKYVFQSDFIRVEPIHHALTKIVLYKLHFARIHFIYIQDLWNNGMANDVLKHPSVQELYLPQVQLGERLLGYS